MNINQIFLLVIKKTLVDSDAKIPRSLQIKSTFILEDVSFQDLSQIIPEIGGFASSLMAVFFIIFGYFINKQWVDSIRYEILNLKENKG